MKPKKFKEPGPKFCWECGKQLRSFKGVVWTGHRDGRPRTMHKDCAKKMFPKGRDGIKL